MAVGTARSCAPQLRQKNLRRAYRQVDDAAGSAGRVSTPRMNGMANLQLGQVRDMHFSDQVDRREIAPTLDEADLHQPSNPSLAYRRG